MTTRLQRPALRVNEIFLSLQGEARSVGLPTVFVRLTGCPLRCQYCDTAYAFYAGDTMLLPEIEKKVLAYGVPQVCVTGGEPLAQSRCLLLLQRLCQHGCQVSLETSGAFDTSLVDPRVLRVIDVKTPGSGEQGRNLWKNLTTVRKEEQIKFVICSRSDYEWARGKLQEYSLPQRCEVLFSPSYGQQEASALAQWILDDRLAVRFQLQMHKFLWGEERGR